MKKLVVFDWDGTIMDSTQRIVASMQGAAIMQGISVPEESVVRDIIGLSLDKAIEIVFPQHSELHPALHHAYREQYVQHCTVPTQLFAGAKVVLGQLAEQYTLAVATGKSRKGLDRVLDDTQLRDYFAATRCADETSSKPDPHMLHELLHELQVSPEHTLMIGDTTYDMEMGLRAGTRRLGVTYGVHSQQRLEAMGAEACIHDIRDLPAWLTANFS